MRKEKLEELHHYIEELKMKRKTLLSQEGKFLTIERYQCELNNQETIFREKILKGKKEGSAAVILPITMNNDTILVVQPRVFTKETVCIELPAGYIEAQEDPMTAGIRELREETGYVPQKMQLLAKYYQDQGCSGAYNYSYLAFGCERKKEQKLDESEFIYYFKCKYEEALELLEKGYITDIQSQYALEKSKKYMK